MDCRSLSNLKNPFSTNKKNLGKRFKEVNLSAACLNSKQLLSSQKNNLHLLREKFECSMQANKRRMQTWRTLLGKQNTFSKVKPQTFNRDKNTNFQSFNSKNDHPNKPCGWQGPMSRSVRVLSLDPLRLDCVCQANAET